MWSWLPDELLQRIEQLVAKLAPTYLAMLRKAVLNSGPYSALRNLLQPLPCTCHAKYSYQSPPPPPLALQRPRSSDLDLPT